jgi:hypothetical protein
MKTEIFLFQLTHFAHTEGVFGRRIFGLKKDEATEEWRRLHNEEFFDL